MLDILEQTGLSVAYHHFSKKDGIQPPFILYVENNTDNFMADDKTYTKFQNYSVWLVTKKKDKNLEERLEEVFDNNSLPYNKTSEDYIEDENIYQVNYEI